MTRRERLVAGKQRVAGSTAGHLWNRLSAVDFINRGMLFAAILLLCLVPFMIVARALAGQGTTASVVRRFGLDDAAAHAMTQVLTSPSATSSAVTGLGYVLFLLSGIAVAGALQELYERAFDLPSRGIKDTHRRMAWLAAFVAVGALVGWVQPWLHDQGGPVLLGLVTLVGATGFWWFTMWLLLDGRLGWGELFPSALATGVCWLGMTVVFRLTMSSTITSNYRQYGAIGVIFALMSYLIAIGVVIILGAVFGVVWRERRRSARSSAADREAAGDTSHDLPHDIRSSR